MDDFRAVVVQFFNPKREENRPFFTQFPDRKRSETHSRLYSAKRARNRTSCFGKSLPVKSLGQWPQGTHKCPFYHYQQVECGTYMGCASSALSNWFVLFPRLVVATGVTSDKYISNGIDKVLMCQFRLGGNCVLVHSRFSC